MVAEDVCVVVFGGGYALFFLQLADGDEEIAIFRGQLKLFSESSFFHAPGERFLELGFAAFEKQLYVADGLAICVGSGESLDTWS